MEQLIFQEGVYFTCREDTKLSLTANRTW